MEKKLGHFPLGVGPPPPLMENAFENLYHFGLLYKCTSQKCLLLKTEQNRTIGYVDFCFCY